MILLYIELGAFTVFTLALTAFALFVVSPEQSAFLLALLALVPAVYILGKVILLDVIRMLKI